MTLPLIALATGDPAGIGPEIALKAAADPRVRAVCRPVLIGDAAVLRRYAGLSGIETKLHPIDDVPEASAAGDAIAILHVDSKGAADVVPGHSDAACGAAVLAYAETALDLARAGKVAAVAAAPHSQGTVRLVRPDFDGYPHVVAKGMGVDPETVFLMLWTGDQRIVHTTLHVGLRQALDMIDGPRVQRAVRAADNAMKRLGKTRPRLAVSGVNPHAGEGGVMGREEIDTIAPALESLRADGLDVHGPFGADTMYLDKSYDAYVVMVHDQGHVPAKIVGFDNGSAFSIGAPITFATVAHGSALQIAGQDKADPSAMIATLLRVAGA